jgi:hypothetical protein
MTSLSPRSHEIATAKPKSKAWNRPIFALFGSDAESRVQVYQEEILMISRMKPVGRGWIAAIAATALVAGFSGSSVKAFAHDYEDGWHDDGREDHEDDERHEAHERHEAEEAQEAWRRHEWQERREAEGYGYYGYPPPAAIYPQPYYAPRYYAPQPYYGGSSLSFSFGGY